MWAGSHGNSFHLFSLFPRIAGSVRQTPPVPGGLCAVSKEGNLTLCRAGGVVAVVAAAVLGAAPVAEATTGSLLVPGDISPGYYWATPTDSIGGDVEVCADYTCDVGRGMIENYTVDGRTMISVPNGAAMVNVKY